MSRERLAVHVPRRVLAGLVSVALVMAQVPTYLTASLASVVPPRAAAAAGFDAELCDSVRTSVVTPGATLTIASCFVNTGQTTWMADTATQINLAICDDIACNIESSHASWNRDWYSTTAYARQSTLLVPPGQQGLFRWSVTVPDGTPIGEYVFQGDLVIAATGEVVKRLNYREIVRVEELLQAVAGPAQRVSFGESVSLQGSALGSVGTPEFSWRQIDGPNVSVAVVPDPAQGSHVTFSAPRQVASLSFELTVRDGERVATDGTVVTVFEQLASGKALFVSSVLGDDANTGLVPEHPLRTLPRAAEVAAISGADLYLHEGKYPLTQTLHLGNGMSIYGGFAAVGRSVCDIVGCRVEVDGWTRTATTPTRLFGPTTTLRVVAFPVTEAMTIDGLQIVSRDGGTKSNGFGENSIPIVVDNAVSLLRITNNTIAAGKGGDGSPGPDGSNGGSGVDGSDGEWSAPGFSSSTGGAGGRGGIGGAGPSGAGPTTRCPAGGRGGGGAVLLGSNGSKGSGPGGGTGGARGVSGDIHGVRGGSGADGISAARGGDGGDGVGAIVTLLAAPDFPSPRWQGNEGDAGLAGGFGSGGGGGGAGYGSPFINLGGGAFIPAGAGGAGGGGAGGGCGGLPGQGGKAGGGSIGIFLNNSSPLIVRNAISTFGGGSGGTGGRGGCGGSGGSPGGAFGINPLGGFGGPGNRGGNGGSASGAGGGGGGISAAWLAANGSEPVTFDNDTGPGDALIGPGGSGGAGGTMLAGCTGPSGEHGSQGVRTTRTGETLVDLLIPLGGQTSTSGLIPSGAFSADFSSRWQGSDIVLSLVSPSGRSIGRDTTSPDVIHEHGATFERYRIAAPEPGTWTLQLFGAEVPAAGEQVTVSVIVRAANGAPIARAGVDLTVEATGPGAATVALDGSSSFDPDGDPLTFAWRDEGNNLLGITPDLSVIVPLGSHVFTLTVEDGHAGIGSDSVQVEVRNVVPTATLNAPAAVNEGSAFEVSLTDPYDTSGVDIADFTYAFDCGRGFEAYGSGNSASCPTTDNGARTVGGRIRDVDGGVSEYTALVVVDNVAPIITRVVGPAGPLGLGSPAGVSVEYSDAGMADTHTCAIAWGAGTSSVVSATPVGGIGSCAATHIYAAAGVYALAITVTDDDSGSASGIFEFVVIYDPAAGFVTGGGWITSLPGAYAADPSLTGRATFGFTSAYKKGAATPSGQTEFQFQIANFSFHGTEYEWLVVAGAKAQYKGRGTVNGDGDYGFLLTATDGQASGGAGTDKFRIKIWNRSTDAVIYDNVLGAPDGIDTAGPQDIGGGSIVIHSK